jgi:hypothetical protein
MFKQCKKIKFAHALNYLCTTICRRVWEGGCIAPSFLTSALDGDEWSASRRGRFTPSIHWIGGWVGTRAGWDAMTWRKFSWSCRESNSGRPFRRSSLHWLSHKVDFWYFARDLTYLLEQSMCLDLGSLGGIDYVRMKFPRRWKIVWHLWLWHLSGGWLPTVENRILFSWRWRHYILLKLL